MPRSSYKNLQHPARAFIQAPLIGGIKIFRKELQEQLWDSRKIVLGGPSRISTNWLKWALRCNEKREPSKAHQQWRESHTGKKHQNEHPPQREQSNTHTLWREGCTSHNETQKPDVRSNIGRHSSTIRFTTFTIFCKKCKKYCACHEKLKLRHAQSCTYHPKWSRHYMAQNKHLEPCKTSSTFTTYIACKKNCLLQHLSFRPTCFVTCTKYCACHGDAKMSDVLYLPRNKEEVLTLQKCRISCPQQNIHSSKKRTRHARENATLQFRGLLVVRILIRSRNFRATIFRRHKPLISP